MLPQDLKAMDEDKQILLVEGMAHPILSTKIRYFKDAAFKDRLLGKAEIPLLSLPGDKKPAVPTTDQGASVSLAQQPGKDAQNPAVDAPPRFASLNIGASERAATTVLEAAYADEA